MIIYQDIAKEIRDGVKVVCGESTYYVQFLDENHGCLDKVCQEVDFKLDSNLVDLFAKSLNIKRNRKENDRLLLEF